MEDGFAAPLFDLVFEEVSMPASKSRILCRRVKDGAPRVL
jgi:hypothetical protein